MHYVNQGLPFMDLFQEGYFGLVDAIDKYVPSPDIGFHEFAAHRIRHSIFQALAKYVRLIDIPIEIGNEANLITKVSEALFEKLEREPTISEIAKRLYCSEDHVAEIIAWTKPTLSLDVLAENPGDYTLIDKSQTDLLDMAEERVLYTHLYNVLTELTEREQKVIELRFGLHDDLNHTLKEVGKITHVTRERVWQIEARALRKLRHPRLWRNYRDWYRY